MREDIQKRIENSPRIQVKLSGMNIHDNEIAEIALTIKQIKPEVESIILNNNEISDDGAIILSNEISSLPNLSFIDLQFNKIDRNGVAAIFSLRKNHPDIILALHGNMITNVGELENIKDANE